MIELCYFTEDDFDQLIDCVTSPEFLLQWSGPGFSYPLTDEQLREYINNSNSNRSKQFVFKVVQTETNTTVGHIALGVDRKNDSARIGKVLVMEQIRGKGVGAEIVKEMVRWSFKKLNLHKISLGVFDFNKSAIRCYQKVGFKIDGLLREHRKINNEYWSLYEMSILKSEWSD